MFKIEGVSFLDWEPVSFAMKSGELVVLVGASGSGKSLLLRSLADLIPHEGDVFLGEVSCSEKLPTTWRSEVGFLPAEILWWEETVGEHFLNAPSEKRLADLGIPADCLAWDPHRLSMGERQRLGILRLLDREPKVLLLDEPTSNLDGETALRVEELIRSYVSEKGACALWVSHSEEQAKRLGARVFRMKEKALVEVVL